MGFDLSTAKPVGGGFDLSTAKPAGGATDDTAQARAYLESTRKARGDAAFKSGNDTVDALVGGAAMGVADIGNTVLNAGAALLPGKYFPETKQANRTRNADFAAITEQNKDSSAFNGARTGSNILMTLPVGGALGAGVKSASPLLVRAGASAPVVDGIANSLATSGFRTGMPAATTLGGRAADLGIRSLGGAVTGGASAGLVNPSDALTGAAIGGGLPAAATVAGKVGGAIRNVVTGGAVSPEVAALAQRAKQLGIDIPADRIAGSKPMNALAASLSYVPMSGRAASEDRMVSGLNRALSRTFGQDSDNVTAALRKAGDDLGGKFDTVLQNNKVQVDNALLAKLGDIETTADRELGADGMKAIKGQITELLDKGQTGEIDGQAAYNIKRTLDRIGKRSTPEAFHAREMKSALMDALDRSIGPQESAAFSTTRKQYGNMMALENLAQNGAEGGVSVARLANMKHINNPDLQELADISAQFVKARESQHGAMQRAVVGGAASVTAGLPGLAAGATLGRGLNMALDSNLLKQALMNGPTPTSPTTNKLLQGLYRSAPILPAH